jgi:Zn-finger nucleic acid-binding protein
MNCRNCGAAMQPVGGAAYFRCNHCGTFEFPQATDEGVASAGEVSRFACPVCRQSLGTAAIEGHPIFYCGVCRGFLTTNPEFSGILLHRRARQGDQPAVPRSLDPAELRRRVGCPKCKKAMDAHPYGGGGNVVIDTCHRCHLVWLDAGEMETIARHRPRRGTAELLLPLTAQKADDSSPTHGQRSADGQWVWDDYEHRWEADISDGSTLDDWFRFLFR